MLFLTLLACSGGTDEDSGHADFEGGNFSVTTTAVDDQCTDGAFDSIFMPTGSAEAWDDTIEIPAQHDLPSTYTITVQDPYGDVEITVSEGANDEEMAVVGEAQTDIPVEGYDGCLVDQAITGTLNIVDADNVTGNIVMTTTGMDEAECPAQTASCTVTLDISAVRQ